jgi:hypothetical protein
VVEGSLGGAKIDAVERPLLSAALFIVIVLGAIIPSCQNAEAVPNVNVDPAQHAAKFLALAEKGLDGDFELTYAVTGTNGDFFRGDSGTLVIAQAAPAGRSAWVTAAGRWSFRLDGDDGAMAQWIESGSSAEDCWRLTRNSAMRCTGPTAYTASNGFTLSTLPFIEGAVVESLRSIVDPVEISSSVPSVVSLFTRPGSRLTGPVTCLRVDQLHGMTTCITRRGVIASVINFYYATVQWQEVQLIGAEGTPRAIDFKPAGKLTQTFEVPPV